MRILFISQWFDPEPVIKGLQFVKALIRRGHEVEVLTGFPNYPGGKIYEGYSLRPLLRETLEGVPVVRLPLYPSHNASALGRAVNYATFAASLSILGVPLAKRFDVAYVYHPPVTVGLAASILTRLRRLPFVYDVQDLWPDTLRATGMVRSEHMLSGVQRACRAVYNRARVITVLSPGFKEALKARGVPEEKIKVIYNWADEPNLNSCPDDPKLADELGFRGRFNVVFAGSLGKAQGLDTLLDSAEILQQRNPRVLVTLVGGGIEAERLRSRAVKMRISNVQFAPRLPMSKIGGLLRAADLLLVHLKDDPLFQMTIPSKTQAYMAVGKPILMAVRGDAAELIRRAGAGLVCEPENARSLADAVCSMAAMGPAALRRLGQNGYAFYNRELSMSAGVQKFESVMCSMPS